MSRSEASTPAMLSPRPPLPSPLRPAAARRAAEQAADHDRRARGADPERRDADLQRQGRQDHRGHQRRHRRESSTSAAASSMTFPKGLPVGRSRLVTLQEGRGRCPAPGASRSGSRSALRSTSRRVQHPRQADRARRSTPKSDPVKAGLKLVARDGGRQLLRRPEQGAQAQGRPVLRLRAARRRVRQRRQAHGREPALDRRPAHAVRPRARSRHDRGPRSVAPIVGSRPRSHRRARNPRPQRPAIRRARTDRCSPHRGSLAPAAAARSPRPRASAACHAQRRARDDASSRNCARTRARTALLRISSRAASLFKLALRVTSRLVPATHGSRDMDSLVQPPVKVKPRTPVPAQLSEPL